MNTHKQPALDCIKKVSLEKTLWKAISEENQAKSVGGAQQLESKQYTKNFQNFYWHWKH